MNHQRHLIREAVVQALVAAATDAGDQVFDEPYDLRTAAKSLSVWDITERQAPQTRPGGPGCVIERLLTLEVRAEVHATGQAGRARDQLLAQAEAALASAAIPGIKSIVPAGYAPQDDHDGDRPLKVGRQRFEVLYYTSAGDPATAL